MIAFLNTVLPRENCDKIADKINETTMARADFDANDAPYYEGDDLRGHVSETNDDGDFYISVYPKDVPDGTLPLAFIACSFKAN